MTVPQNPNIRTEAVGNGVTTVFAFDFLCLEARDLQVTVSGTLLTPPAYSVSGLGQAQGGTVTFSVAPASGAPILMELVVVAARAIDYQDFGDLFAETVNFDFDRLWLAIKSTFGWIRRALLLGPHDIDGQGAYRARQNRISDLADPVSGQDAANRQWVLQQLADLSVDGSGQFVLDMLADGTSTDLGTALISGAGRTVDTIADVRKQRGSKNRYVIAAGYYARGDMAPALYLYDSSDTTSADNGGTVLVSQYGDRYKLATGNVVTAQNFGVMGDGVRDNAARLAVLRTWAAQKYAAGFGVSIRFPAGHYAYSQGQNWAIPGLQLIAEGSVWLINTGPDISFLCDGSYIGGGVRGMSIQGDFRVYPNASSTIGVLIKSVHVSDIQITSRGAGSTYSAIFIEACVCTVFRIRASGNDGGWVNTPARCLYVTQSGPNGETSYCTFINPVLEGSPVGALLDGTLGNTFIGGTIEATGDTGLILTGNAKQNKFISIDFEENFNFDIFCQGNHNEFLNCDTLKKVVISGGSDNIIHGGLHQLIEIQAASQRNLISTLKYNRASGTAYPVDNGTGTRFRDLTNIGTGRMHNAPPTVTQITVGASPFTYTNNTGNDVSVHVIPGTMTAVSIVRAGQFLPTSTSYGNYLLSPGDGIQIAYSAVPAVFVMPR